jgi:acetolactate synthase-1/2/3 large subunit
VLDDNCIVFDETIAQNQLHDYLNIAAPGGYFHNPASSGGWASGAAFGAKLAAPDKDVIAVSGDGFYMFGTPVHALWAARHYKAPFMAVVYQNRSYSTGTLRINSVYGAKDSYAAKADYDGGYFDPPIDFAKEAEAAGAYGENVTDPAQIEPALRRGLKAIREEGRPAVISVWLARLLQKD